MSTKCFFLKMFSPLFLLITGMSVNSLAGIEVGNGGQRVYRSAVGYSFQYDSRLELNAADKNKIALNNINLIQPELEPVSRIRFGILSPRDTGGVVVRTFEQLSSHLKHHHPGTRFQQIHFPGVQGFVWKKMSPSRVESVFFLLTREKVLLRIDLDAYRAGSGISLMSKVLSTLSADLHPPRLNRVWIEKKLEAGKEAEIHFEATDEGSGIQSFRAVLEPLYGKRDIYLFEAETRRISGNHYVATFHLNRFVHSGRYVLKTFRIDDHSNNSSYYRTPDPGDSSEEPGKYIHLYRRGADFPQAATQIPLLKFWLYNPGPEDTVSPVVHEFRMNPVIRAGNRKKLFFRVTDNLSGISDQLKSSQGFESGRAKNKSRISVSGKIRPEGRDWYSVEVVINPFQPDGEYFLDGFSVLDRAGNSSGLLFMDPARAHYLITNPKTGKPVDTGIPVMKIQVVNNGESDLVAPLFMSFALDTPAIFSGEIQRIWVRMDEDQSGVQPDSLDVKFRRKGEVAYSQDITRVGPLKKEKEDHLYSFEILADPFMAPGEFSLDSIEVRDQAGNTTRLLALPGRSASAGTYDQSHEFRIPEFKKDNADSGIQIFQIHVW